MRVVLSVSLFAMLLGGCYRSFELSDGDGGVPPPTALCTSTGGTLVSGCCAWHCGEPCTLLCVSKVCRCGSPRQVWDPVYGCVDSVMCVPRAG